MVTLTNGDGTIYSGSFPAMRVTMRRFSRLSVAIGLAVAVQSCATSRPPKQADVAGTRRTDLIMEDEIRSREWNDAWDMISALRGNWLSARGPDSFSLSAEIQVLVDGTRLGPIAVLHNHPVGNVVKAQYYDPIAAAARFGLLYNKGAIELSTAAGANSKRP